LSCLVCAVLGVIAAAATPAEVRKSASSVIDSSYQRQLPHQQAGGDGDGAVGDGRAPRRWQRRQDRPRERRQREPATLPAGGVLSTIASALMYVLIGVGLVLLVLFVVWELGGYKPDESVEEETEGDDDAVDVAVVQKPLGDAEALAGHGRFGEAIHVLLLRTLEKHARRVTVRLPRSLTSREILARVAVPEDARQALADLVTAAEVSHFGDHDPDEADYRTCREQFHRFASAYTRGQM